MYTFIHILSLTAQGINRSWTRVKYVLAIRELPGSHTADNINAATREILCEWEINQSRCHVFLRDGAANMKKVFEGSFDHADGAAHKLNLTVKSVVSASGSAVKDCLTKCRKIAGHFSSSNLAKDLLGGI
uniref:Uncharacterized protein n=1 Tax=Ditylenchus dipsaci TaxID=166011 RepID=A0A915D107_9BILA